MRRQYRSNGVWGLSDILTDKRKGVCGQEEVAVSQTAHQGFIGGVSGSLATMVK